MYSPKRTSAFMLIFDYLILGEFLKFFRGIGHNNYLIKNIINSVYDPGNNGFTIDNYIRFRDAFKSLIGTTGQDYPGNIIAHQNNPDITPLLSISIFSAAGFFGSPGIIIMLPAIGTINPAPDARSIFLIFTLKSFGRPFFDGSSESDFCVFAIHTARFPSPSFSILSS